MVKFSGLTILEFINHDKVTFFSERTFPDFSHSPRQVKHVRFPSIQLQRETQKIFSIASVTQRIVQTRSSIFYYMIDKSIYTRNLSACNSGQYICVTGLHNFFFVLQDLIDRILIFREQLFGGTSFLLASNTIRHKFFPMKISSLH